MKLSEYFSFGKDKREKIIVSKRLRNIRGEPVIFEIRGLDPKEIKELKTEREEDFISGVIERGCVEPSFEGAYIYGGLLPGEAVFLYGEIMRESGLDKSFSELKSEVLAMLGKGESEAVYSCLAAFEMGILPREFCKMDIREKACIGAFIDEKIRIKKKGR